MCLRKKKKKCILYFCVWLYTKDFLWHTHTTHTRFEYSMHGYSFVWSYILGVIYGCFLFWATQWGSVVLFWVSMCSTRLRYVPNLLYCTVLYCTIVIKHTNKRTLHGQLICHLARTAPSEMGCNYTYTAFPFAMMGNCGGFRFLVNGQIRYISLVNWTLGQPIRGYKCVHNSFTTKISNRELSFVNWSINRI